jgi:hypothetical protein
MKHILGFTKSHWMPSLGKYLRHIAMTATMVGDFGGKHKTQSNTAFS